MIHPPINHVFRDEDAKDLIVRCGEWDTSTTSENLPHQDIQVEKVTYHPLLGNRQVDKVNYNIAVVMLEEDFRLGKHISTMCLPEPYLTEFGSEDCFVTGFGSKEPNGDNENIMKRYKLDLVERNECQSKIRNKTGDQFFGLHRFVTCAGGGENDINVCENQGNPLICPGRNGQTYYQVSLVMNLT